MDTARFQRWLDDYVAAWRTYDETAIASLWSEDAEYRYHPWDEPVSGRDAVVASWLAEPDAEGSWSAEYRPWAIDGDRAVAVGVSRYHGDDEREYHNVFLCRFDEHGRCCEFTELYLKRSG
jgi:hypothetical protein